MTNKEKIFFWWFFIVYMFWVSILIFKYDFKIKMLPICAGQWCYVYYDNEAQMCKCYNWYTRIEWKIWCFKKY